MKLPSESIYTIRSQIENIADRLKEYEDYFDVVAKENDELKEKIKDLTDQIEEYHSALNNMI